jgi:hypothetical protein
MNTNRRPIQRSLDNLAPRATLRVKRGVALIGEPFVSPIARIPTNRNLLTKKR